jgi:pre-mRNA-splicing factor ATP-dependent RNA helicase DHX15/PRP43
MDAIARNLATMTVIRALEDDPINPITATTRPNNYHKLLKARRTLPVYQQFDQILECYHKHQVFVLTGETGSGKSTQTTQLLVYDEFASRLRIACTQPRRLAATSLATRVAKEMGVSLGEHVGYHIGTQKRIDGKFTRLAYMTDGVLLRQQISDRDFSEYSCVILDEVHERTVETDLLLAMLKLALKRRQDLKAAVFISSIHPVESS